LGEAVTVIVSPAAGVNIEKGFLYHRDGNMTEFLDSIPLSRSKTGFIAVIPGEDVREEGISYYVQVENSGIFEADPPDAPDSLFYQIVKSPENIVSIPLPNEGTGYLEGSEILVNVILPPGASFTAGTLYFRRGGDIIYQNVPLQMGDLQPFGTIPNTMATASGLDYWVEVHTLTTILTDPLNQPGLFPNTLRITVTNLEEQYVHPGGRYRMMSIPLEMEGTITGAFTDDIGGPDLTRWRMFAYQSGQMSYVEVPNDSISNTQLGLAYWLITQSSHRLDTGPVRGLSAPTEGYYHRILKPGWNMVGNPFPFSVAWDSCYLDSIKVGESDSIPAEPPIGWGRNGGYQYDLSILEPFEGYWIKNLNSAEITLKIPPQASMPSTRTDSCSSMTTIAENSSMDGGWQIEIRMSSGDLIDVGNRLVVLPGAVDTWDRHDRSKPPMQPGKSIALYFPHFSWEDHADIYSTDIRGDYNPLALHRLGLELNSEDLWGHLWRFDLVKNYTEENAGDEIFLDFIGLEDIPSDAEIYLIDQSLKHLVDLTTQTRYSFFERKKPPIKDEKLSRFVFVVGSKSFMLEQQDQWPSLPATTFLWQNFPNPFNPSTIIRYEVADHSTISLKIFDTTGALVKTVSHGSRGPGRYETCWFGKNSRGQTVASGLYYYRLESSTGYQSTRKMLFLK